MQWFHGLATREYLDDYPSQLFNMSEPHPEAQLTIRQVLTRYPGFRRLWQARLCSLLGDWFNTLALFAMLRELNCNTPAIIGVMYILKLIPMFLLSPAAGVLADRFNRVNIMIVSDVLRCLMVLCFFLMPLFPSQAPTITLTLVFFQACIGAFFEPAKIAVMPNLIPLNGLMAANALSSVSWSICYAIGTALGGAMTYAFGWRVVIGLDALSYIVSAALILKIGYKQAKRPKSLPGGGWKKISGFNDMVDGFAYLKGHPRTTYILFFKTGLAVAGATEAVFTLLGERVYNWGGRPDLGIGTLLAARAMGTGLGPILGRRFTQGNPEHMRQLMLKMFAFSGCCYLLLAVVQHPVVAMLCALAGASGSGLVWVFSSVMLQQLVPDQFRGRVFSAELGMTMATMAASIFCFTRIAEWPGVEITQLPMGLGLLVLLSGAVLTAFGRHKAIRGKF